MTLAPPTSRAAGAARFLEAVLEAGLEPPRPLGIETVQVNLGPRCNLSCSHCHVRAGPGRTEAMDGPTLDAVLALCARLRPSLVDLTGGAPELHPRFREAVDALARSGSRVQVRSNLTLLAEERFADLPAFLAERRVAVVGSLPVPLEEGFRLQRGAGALEPAIEGLRRLEAAGLGREGGPGLVLVHNPAGPSLPPLAAEVEAEARRALAGRGLSVPRIEAMVNAPVGRFGDALRAAGTLEAYLELLRAAFRPESLGTLDCLRQLSLGWDGRAYDCDFNLALGRPSRCGGRADRFDPGAFLAREIAFGDHCLACAARAGAT
jgi:radical SAM/Cys-rich protein